MAALTQPRTPLLEPLKTKALPLAAGQKVWAGGAICIDTSAGYAKKMASGNANLVRVGVAAESVDNTTGGNGAAYVLTEFDHEVVGQWFDNASGGSAVTSLYGDVYAVDDHTVGNAAIGGGAAMGLCLELDTVNGVLVVPTDVL
jgi:hypothetical protein